MPPVDHSPTSEQQLIIDSITAPESQMISAYAGCAKALRNDQHVATPTGFKPIGLMEVGDPVIGKSGKIYKVTGVYPQGIRELFELGFSDGTSVVATEDHIWTVQRSDDRRAGRFRNVTTADLLRKPRMRSGPGCAWGNGTRAYWWMPMARAAEFTTTEKLKIDPWFMGILLGDGCLQPKSVSFSSADAEIVDAVRVIISADFDELKVTKTAESGYDYRITNKQGNKGTGNELLNLLRQYGVAGTRAEAKYIPQEYKMASAEDRLALLQGLLDSDGYADESRAVFTSASMCLAQGVKFLVESLGGTATENEFRTSGYVAFRLNIKLPAGVQAFRLKRKAKNYRTGQRPPYRTLEYVRQVENDYATCISVDSPDKLFLTNNFIPTHNTTTLQMAGQRVRKPALALAFNKSIATELQARLPGNFTCKSLNALGHGAWSRRLGGRRLDVQSGKLGKLITQTAKDRKIKLQQDQWDQTRRLVQAAMGVGLTPRDAGDPLVPDSPDTWAELADRLWISWDAAEPLIDLAREILEQNNALAEQGTISFDDQIYCPIVLGGQFIRFPVVFGDEAQDWNAMNHEMVGRSLQPGGKLVICGDPKQAIYAFRGALSDSMAKTRRLAKHWIDQSLTQTFRCPKAVVARQQAHAPGYRAAEGNREGKVHDWRLHPTTPDAEIGWNWEKLRSVLPGPGSSVAVLCRNNAPILSLAFKLIRQGVSVQVLGRDIGKGLVALSRKVAPDDSTPPDQIAMNTMAWKDRESEKARRDENPDAKLDSISDKAECLLAVLDSVSSAGDLRTAIGLLFNREDGRVTLSSIHKAKGLEWQVVVMLDPWRIPSQQARKAEAKGDPVPMTQELNLKYVGETRAQEVLVLASLEDFE